MGDVRTEHSQEITGLERKLYIISCRVLLRLFPFMGSLETFHFHTAN